MSLGFIIYHSISQDIPPTTSNRTVSLQVISMDTPSRGCPDDDDRRSSSGSSSSSSSDSGSSGHSVLSGLTGGQRIEIEEAWEMLLEGCRQAIMPSCSNTHGKQGWRNTSSFPVAADQRTTTSGLHAQSLLLLLLSAACCCFCCCCCCCFFFCCC